jgi:hypothetical protein
MPEFQFSDVVVVDDDQIGVIVKSWENGSHEVYVRSYNQISTYNGDDIQHFVYGKSLSSAEYKVYDMSSPQGEPRGSAIEATYHHDKGAFGRCSYCGRYSDHVLCLGLDFECECGKKGGFCGSFPEPTLNSKWNN